MKDWDLIGSITRTARNSPWLVMSIAAHVIVVAALSIVYMGKERAPVPDEAFVFLTPTRSLAAEESLEEPRIEPIVRTMLPPDLSTEVVPDELAFDLVRPPTDEPDFTQEVGDPDSSSEFTGGDIASGSIGVGPGSSLRGTRPNPFGSRPFGSGPGGPQKGDLRANTPTQRSVLDGLRWLARHQNPDGSWGARSLAARCDADHPCVDPKAELSDHYDEGLTGLALLCFLGAGFSHESKAYVVDTARAKQHVLGDVVKRGLLWLKDRQNKDGSFSRDRAFLYNEALATMAMAEAYGLSQNRYWMDSAQRGVEFLVAAQRPSPTGNGLWGWRYASRMDVEQFQGSGASMDEQAKKDLFDSDTSVTGWAVMALKSAEISGLRVDRRAFEGAMAFAKYVTASDGLVGYLTPQGAGQSVSGPKDHFTYHPTVMSALGMCIRIFAEHDPDDPFLDLAAKRIVADLPTISKDKLSVDYYYWYYGSLALNQLDGPDSPRKSGKYWGPWNKAMVDAVTETQDKAERTCGSGGWLFGDRWSYAGGPVYTTAINVLTLEVYYRYENAFGGGKRAPVRPEPDADEGAVRHKMLLVRK